MLRDLAIHFQKGAEKYGVDNWKNGIPATGGGRGGSFEDSGLRHLNQYFRGETDENHFAAALWNFWVFGSSFTIRFLNVSNSIRLKMNPVRMHSS